MRHDGPSATRGPRRTTGVAAATLLLTDGATGTATAPPAGAAPVPVTHDDFNNAGYRDLVVSAPGGTVNGQQGAGYVAVLYGSASGLSPAHRATSSMSTPVVVGLARTGDHFGQATATADLDRDGYDDLVVGAPGEDGGNGGVRVFPSASSGPSVDRSWSFDGGTLHAPSPTPVSGGPSPRTAADSTAGRGAPAGTPLLFQGPSGPTRC